MMARRETVLLAALLVVLAVSSVNAVSVSARALRARLEMASKLSAGMDPTDTDYPYLAAVGVVMGEMVHVTCIGVTISPGMIAVGAHCLFKDGGNNALKNPLENVRAMVDRSLLDASVAADNVLKIEKVDRYSNYCMSSSPCHYPNFGDLAVVYLAECKATAPRVLINDNPSVDANPSDRVLSVSWGVSDCRHPEGRQSLKIMPVDITLPRDVQCRSESEGSGAAEDKQAFYTVCYQDPSNNYCEKDIGGPTFVHDEQGHPVWVGIASSTTPGLLGEIGATRVSQFADWLMARVKDDVCVPKNADYSQFFSGNYLTKGKSDFNHRLTYIDPVHGHEVRKYPVSDGLKLIDGGVAAELTPGHALGHHEKGLTTAVLSGVRTPSKDLKWNHKKLEVARVEEPIVIDDDSLPQDSQPEYKDDGYVDMGAAPVQQDGQVHTTTKTPCCPTCSNPCPPSLYAFTNLGQPIV